ncbi:MAG: transposase [Candidatus Methanoculleus thermohydrogenotrophicum]
MIVSRIPGRAFTSTMPVRTSASKIGNIPIVLHRPIEGTIKTLTIRRTATGKWYACFSVEYEPAPAREKDTVVGVDAGLESFATLSNGEKNKNPRFFRTDEKALAKAQRKLSKTESGTPKRLSHASMNGSPIGATILLTRPPSRMLVF